MVDGLELKEKSVVTGNVHDNGYVLIDNREQLAARRGASLAPGAQGAAPGNANWAALTPEQRRRARLEHEIATGQTNNGGVVASLRPSAIEKRKQELAAMGDDERDGKAQPVGAQAAP